MKFKVKNDFESIRYYKTDNIVFEEELNSDLQPGQEITMTFQQDHDELVVLIFCESFNYDWQPVDIIGFYRSY